MRLHIHTSRNTETIPFNYLHALIRALHRWLGMNAQHDDLSLYSFSWLRGRNHSNTVIEGGYNFSGGAEWFLSFYDEQHVRTLLAAMMKDSAIAFGMRVEGVDIQETPTFAGQARFLTASPVLAKQFDGSTVRHRLFSDAEADAVLTQTLRTKLRRAGLPDDATVRFDRSFAGAKTKLVDIHGVKNRASVCPVIVEGAPEAVAFAWTVGVGHSTGCGFGALR